MNIFIVRHGATEWNEKDLVQGNIDLSLSEKGKKAVEKTAEYLKSIDFKVVFTSSMTRSKETGEIIAAKKGIKGVVSIKELDELDCGDWEGLSMDEIRGVRVDEYKALLKSPDYKIPGGESFHDVVSRFKKGWEKLLDKAHGENILFVSHIVITRAFLYSNLGIPYGSIRNFIINNGSVSMFEFDKNRYFMKLWNYQPYKNEIS
jgi:broad specificity phosphatase PhoE